MQLTRETSVWSVDSTVRFSCKKENRDFNICGDCQSCLFTRKLYDSTEWLLKADEPSKRRFLTGILVRCQNIEILESVLNVLQVTLGKDFTYARARVKASVSEDMSSRDSDKTLDPNVLRMSVLNTWEWFSNSPNWTKSNFLMGILSLCGTELLHMLGNLIRVLIAREKRKFLQYNTVSVSVDDDFSSLLESNDSFQTGDHLDRFHFILLQTSKEASLTELEKDATRSPTGKSSDVDSEDPAFMVVPRSSKSMSGVSLHRDFIRGLPVYIAKKILGLLDKFSLQSCRQVSQHWKYLTEEILTDFGVKKMVEDQAMVFQGSSCSGVNPSYARIREVLVPCREEDKYIHPAKLYSRSKKDVKGFESVYMGVKTKAVEMEERNVFCGVFNILILLDREDPSRVVHYGGGRAAAVGSRDRVVRLLDIPLLKEAPPLMQGHVGSVRAVLVCEERALVISASYDLTIRCWNLNTGACTMLLTGHTGTINCLDLHGHLLVSGARDCKVKVWSLLSGQCLKRLRFSHQKPVRCVKIHTPVVLSGCEGGLVRMWDTETAALLKVMEGHQGPVRCLFFDQWHILSGGSDGQALAWSTNSDFTKCLMTFPHPREVPTLSFLFLRVITGCADGKIRIFNFLSGDCLRVIKISTHQSTVLSLHTHHNNILVNSSSRVLLLQFAQVCWDYVAKLEGTPGVAGIPVPSRDLPSHRVPHSRTAPTALSSAIRRPESRGAGLAPGHPTRSCSAPSTKLKERGVWRQLQARLCSRAGTDLWVESSGEPLSSLSPGRPHSYSIRDTHSCPSRSPTSAWENPPVTSKHVMTLSERAVRERVRKRGLHHPLTPAQMLLKVGGPTHQPHSCDLASSNMKLNARVRDAWGPLPPDPNREKQTGASPPPPCKAPRRPRSAPGPVQCSFKGMVKIYTPLQSHTVGLNLRNSLHSGQIRSSIPSPTLVRPQSGQVFPKRPQTAGSARRVGAITTTAETDVCPPQPMLMRSAGKRSGRRVDFDVADIKPVKAHNPLDPFREHGGLQLKTDTEVEELIQAHLHTELSDSTTHSAELTDRQRRAAWKLKIKGVSACDYTREGQVYAPELGDNTYI